MRELLAWILSAALTVGWLIDHDPPATAPSPMPAPTDTSAQVFDIAAVTAELEASGQPWLAFLDVPTLRTGLYRLPAGGTDRQQPHDEDEVYYVLAGRATLAVEDVDYPVQPGSVLFVKAHAAHRFHTITEELTLLVFFSTADPA